LLDKRRLDTVVFERTMKQLIKQKCVEKHDDRYTLSEEGLTQAARIVRLHRLWELYLTARLNFKKDHIHGTAETIEHLITEEMEEVLLKELDFPEHDPHQKPIPYDGFKRK
jgi:manganese/zinc/iron transport system permease protein